MSEHQAERSTDYKRTREAFDDLKIEDKALFLVEAAVSTVARAVEHAGRVLAHELDAVFEKLSDLGRPHQNGEAEAEEEQDKEEEATATKAAPKKAAPKKAAAKKTTTRKRSTSRKTTKKPDDDEGASS